MDSKEIINVFKYFELLQTEILEKIQNHEDCADIKNNKWSRDSENFGNALILEKGAVFDKIALNISHVKGNELRSSASIKNKDLKHYFGERGRRGRKLPRGFQRVDRLDCSAKEE